MYLLRNSIVHTCAYVYIGIATCCALLRNMHAIDDDEGDKMLPCVVGGWSTVGSKVSLIIQKEVDLHVQMKAVIKMIS